MKYLLFNPHSGCGNSHKSAEDYSATLGADTKLLDMTEITSYKAFLDGLGEGDEVFIFGGDGTLNRFINGIDSDDLKNDIYYSPCGTGNDFCVDVEKTDLTEPFLINSYIKNLPTVTVKGEKHKFINGVGYGIDGYCCEVGDKQKEAGKKPNYTSIAIKGLLFHFKPVNATVIVDGVEMKYKKVWIAPTMFGRHYGGGMVPTPAQSRDDSDPHLSVMLFHGSNKIKTLTIFPSIFKGEHVKHTECVTVHTGKKITVKFDRPTPLQIDGETVLNVEEYTASI